MIKSIVVKLIETKFDNITFKRNLRLCKLEAKKVRIIYKEAKDDYYIEEGETGETVTISRILYSDMVSWNTRKKISENDTGRAYLPKTEARMPSGTTILHPLTLDKVCVNKQNGLFYRLDVPLPFYMDGRYDPGRGGTEIIAENKGCNTIKRYFDDYIQRPWQNLTNDTYKKTYTQQLDTWSKAIYGLSNSEKVKKPIRRRRRKTFRQ